MRGKDSKEYSLSKTSTVIFTQLFGFGGEQLTNVAKTLKQNNPELNYSKNIRNAIKSKGLYRTISGGSALPLYKFFPNRLYAVR